MHARLEREPKRAGQPLSRDVDSGFDVRVRLVTTELSDSDYREPAPPGRIEIDLRNVQGFDNPGGTYHYRLTLWPSVVRELLEEVCRVGAVVAVPRTTVEAQSE